MVWILFSAQFLSMFGNLNLLTLGHFDNESEWILGILCGQLLLPIINFKLVTDIVCKYACGLDIHNSQISFVYTFSEFAC